MKSVKNSSLYAHVKMNDQHTISATVEWNSAKADTEYIYAGSNDIDQVSWYHANSGKQKLSENLWTELDQPRCI